jgi:predicted nucleic acid-binding protein
MSLNEGLRITYILDTNIWLDWLVFSSDTLVELKVAHNDGEFEIIYTTEMIEELIDVVSRTQFDLSPEQQELIVQQMMAAARRVDDKDDQVFIDTALAYRITWLISKDKHLLRLKNRAAKQQVNIGTVDDWLRKRQAL